MYLRGKFQVQLAKREKENARNMRKSNMRKLTQVLHDLDKLSHKTTWKEAQELLIGQAEFIDDKAGSKKLLKRLFPMVELAILRKLICTGNQL